MNKLRLAAVAAVTGAIAMFSSVPAQATYVDVTVILTADSPVVGGKTVNFSVTTSSGTVDCDWTVTFSDGVASDENETRTGSGTSFSGSYESKVVASSTPTTMTARCDYDDGQVAPVSASTGSGNTVSPAVFSSGLQAAPQNASDSATVILLPEGGLGGEDDGELPDTGGSNLSWLLIGGALVLAGGGITYAARRRHSAR